MTTTLTLFEHGAEAVVPQHGTYKDRGSMGGCVAMHGHSYLK